jgi:carboxymethylenebutenolidase
MVTFPSNGGTDTGYLATPESGQGPGVVVIQEWWGLVPHIQDVCNRFAREGFVALAPDLYHGKQTKEPDEAGKLLMAMNIEQAAKDMRGAAVYLKGLPSVTSQQVGIVGFCMGGLLAVYGASVSPDIGPVVDFYGGFLNVKPDYSKIRGPVLAFVAGRDDSFTPEMARGMESALKGHGVQTELKIYPNADHAFFNDARKDEPNTPFDPQAAQDAWQRTIAFFRQHLK